MRASLIKWESIQNYHKHTDRELILVRVKLESRVIAHKYGAVKFNLSGVLTARHGLVCW